MLTKEEFAKECEEADRQKLLDTKQEIADLIAIWHHGARPRRARNPDGLMSDKDWYFEMARVANRAGYLEKRLKESRDFETAYEVYQLCQSLEKEGE